MTAEARLTLSRWLDGAGAERWRVFLAERKPVDADVVEAEQ